MDLLSSRAQTQKLLLYFIFPSKSRTPQLGSHSKPNGLVTWQNKTKWPPEVVCRGKNGGTSLLWRVFSVKIQTINSNIRSFNSNIRSFNSNIQSFNSNLQLFGSNFRSFNTNIQSFSANMECRGRFKHSIIQSKYGIVCFKHSILQSKHPFLQSRNAILQVSKHALIVLPGLSFSSSISMHFVDSNMPFFNSNI